MDRVRIGIVGVGNIATLNVPGYLAHEHCDVVALCDPRAEVLERRAREWHIDRTYAHLDALLADPDIDAVEILGPTPLHAEHVVAAARAGSVPGWCLDEAACSPQAVSCARARPNAAIEQILDIIPASFHDG